MTLPSRVAARAIVLLFSACLSLSVFLAATGGVTAWAALYGPRQGEQMNLETQSGVRSLWPDRDPLVEKDGPPDAHGDISTGNLGADAHGNNALRFDDDAAGETSGGALALPSTDYAWKRDIRDTILEGDVNGDGIVFYWIRARIKGAGCGALRFWYDGPVNGDERFRLVTITNSSAYRDIPVRISRPAAVDTETRVTIWRANGTVTDQRCSRPVLLDMFGHKDYRD